jgi:hypothetical protein
VRLKAPASAEGYDYCGMAITSARDLAFEIPDRIGHKTRQMTWFRTKLRHGATLALIALALNLALAFGHCHADGGRGHQAAISALNFGVSDDGSIPINTNGDDDGCAICKAVAALGSALAATSPTLPLVVTFARLDLTPVTELAVRQFARTDVRARGPPSRTSLT